MIVEVPTNSSSDLTGFDVIGDIHGCSDHLLALLHELGYANDTGTFRHSTRQAVFVGDLIDRGPNQVEVLRIVRSMTQAGTAQVVMGNHEFNAIAYATPDQATPGDHLRPHTDKNNRQHAQFLAQIRPESADYNEIIQWFTTLPLWLDLDGLRIVHACWDPNAMAGLGTPYLDGELVVAASTEGDPAYEWVENLCKGPEVPLPNDHSFHDKDGHERFDARLRWWDDGPATYASMCEVPPNCTPPLPDSSIDPLPVQPYHDDVPVIFGHFWREWPKIEMTNTTACVDYSAVNGGPLVAYRWSGEFVLDESNLHATSPECTS